MGRDDCSCSPRSHNILPATKRTEYTSNKIKWFLYRFTSLKRIGWIGFCVRNRLSAHRLSAVVSLPDIRESGSPLLWGFIAQPCVRGDSRFAK